MSLNREKLLRNHVNMSTIILVFYVMAKLKLSQIKWLLNSAQVKFLRD